MFLAKGGEYPPCGMFNYKHFILFFVVIFCACCAVKFTKVKNKEEITKIIKKVTIFVWIMEILKIGFNFAESTVINLNKIIPLYYCSLLLYSGILSGFCKGVAKKMGDVFLATGAIIGGVVFIMFPTTSLPEYPAFHFISIHSFLFHGLMIYLGLLINKYKYIDLRASDIKYYAGLIFIICVGAYIVNCNFGSNLMFISRDFPGTPLEAIYKYTGKFFTVVMVIAQMTIPFYMVYGIKKIIDKIKCRIEREEELA